MKFFLDENIPISLVDVIKSLGFETEHARHAGLIGASDKKIAEYAKNKQAILITRDLDFGSVIIYPNNSHYGLIILRLPYFYTSKQIIEIVKKFLTNAELKIIIGSVIILEIGRYRLRKIS